MKRIEKPIQYIKSIGHYDKFNEWLLELKKKETSSITPTAADRLMTSPRLNYAHYVPGILLEAGSEMSVEKIIEEYKKAALADGNEDASEASTASIKAYLTGASAQKDGIEKVKKGNVNFFKIKKVEMHQLEEKLRAEATPAKVVAK